MVPLTLENMCVIGLVTLMLSKPAIQSKKPKKPVTMVPHKNTFPFQSAVAVSDWKIAGSPRNSTNGRIMIAEPRLVQYAS